ncbi:MAG: glycosyltransferase [Bacteroidota bacterium]
MIEITIPILNEEKTLDKQVRKAYYFIKNNMVDFGSIRIILADNGSTDSTPEIARLLTLELAGVQYLRLEQRGVGLALKASWEQSNADIVGYMDLDLATDLRYLRPALDKLQADQADIITGSRLVKGAKVIGRSTLRDFTSRGFNLIIKIIFQTSLSDGMCGFKFLKRSCLENLLEAGAESDGWFFATEILITGEYLGYRVRDLAVEWTDDPESKVKIGKLAIEYLKAMRVLRSRLPNREKV